MPEFSLTLLPTSRDEFLRSAAWQPGSGLTFWGVFAVMDGARWQNVSSAAFPTPTSLASVTGRVFCTGGAPWDGGGEQLGWVGCDPAKLTFPAE